MERLIGKVQRFNSNRNSGVLASIGGTSLDFTHTRAADARTRFTVGQVVTYCVVGDPTNPAAADVRAQG